MTIQQLLGWKATGYSHISSKCSRPARLALEQLEERCLLAADPVLEWNAIADSMPSRTTAISATTPSKPDRPGRPVPWRSWKGGLRRGQFDRWILPALSYPGERGTRCVNRRRGRQAAHDTLLNLFPDYQSVLDSRLATDLTQVPSAVARDEGVRVGKITAAAILAARLHDGSDAAMPYVPGTQPGQWQPDPYHPNQTALGSLWGDVTPFALGSAEQFHVPPPPALTSKAYTEAFNEVKNYGGTNPDTLHTRADVDRHFLGLTTMARPAWGRRLACTTKSRRPWPSRGQHGRAKCPLLRPDQHRDGRRRGLMDAKLITISGGPSPRFTMPLSTTTM